MAARQRKSDEVTLHCEWPDLEKSARFLLDLVSRAAESAPMPVHEVGTVQQGRLRLDYHARVGFLSEWTPLKPTYGRVVRTQNQGQLKRVFPTARYDGEPS